MKILLSDLHIAPFKKGKFQTQKKNFIEWIIQFFASILGEKELGIFELMQKISREEGISLGISNGDLMEATATERGWATEKDFLAAKKIISDLESELGIRLEMNMGNHETGYILPLSTDMDGGMSKQSIGNFLSLAKREDVYYSFLAEGFRFIFIPYFFTEKIAKDFDLAKMKEEFSKKMKLDLRNSVEPVIIFIHDPDSMMDENLSSEIWANREKIKAIFYGHYHSELNLFFAKILVKIFNYWWLVIPRLILNVVFWTVSGRNMRIVRELGKYFRSRKNIPDMIKALKMILIPAPTGMFGIGGGFLTLEIFSDGSFQIKRYKA